jgi:hypothetical protein
MTETAMLLISFVVVVINSHFRIIEMLVGAKNFSPSLEIAKFLIQLGAEPGGEYLITILCRASNGLGLFNPSSGK